MKKIDGFTLKDEKGSEVFKGNYKNRFLGIVEDKFLLMIFESALWIISLSYEFRQMRFRRIIKKIESIFILIDHHFLVF